MDGHSAQSFRAGDVVEVREGMHAGERWVVAVYDAARDVAWIAGWPCTEVLHASTALTRVELATDAQHAEIVAAIDELHGDPRALALRSIRARGGTP